MIEPISTPKMTTVSVDPKDRDAINTEATKRGLSQRQMVSSMVAYYRQEGPEAKLERILAFMKEQEKLFLNPTLNEVQYVKTHFSELLSTLKETLS